MIDQELIPTPLPLAHGDKKTITIVPHIDARWRSLSIVFRLTVLALRVAALFVSGRATGDRVGDLTKRTLEDLGFLWVKAGQLLSLRADILSEAFCRRLAQLQHAAKGFPGHAARAIIEEELGYPPEELFAEYSDQPFAAGSIAQVHRARLIDGTPVVVKIMRPGAERIFAIDMRFLKRGVAWLERLGILPFVRWHEGIWELGQMMKEEVDYRHEQSNLLTMRELLHEHGVVVPQLYEQYCSKHVLVMEFISGPIMSDYISASEADPTAVEDWCLQNGILPSTVGIKLYKSFLRQLLEDNRFHGDLHPGNIILLRDNNVALIDFGTVGTVERSLLRRYIFIIRSIADYDLQKACDMVLSLVPEFPPVDLDELREEMVRSLRAWAAQSSLSRLAYHDKAMTDAVVDLARIMAKQRLMITWGFLKIDRTWATLDASMNALVPEIDYPRLFREYFEERGVRMVRRLCTGTAWVRALVDAYDAASEYALFVDPQIRRFGRQFVGLTTVADSALALFFGLLQTGAFVFSLLVAVTLLERYGVAASGIVHSLNGVDALHLITSDPPRGVSSGVLWALLVIDVYFLWKVRGVLRAAKVGASLPS